MDISCGPVAQTVERQTSLSGANLVAGVTWVRIPVLRHMVVGKMITNNPSSAIYGQTWCKCIARGITSDR